MYLLLQVCSLHSKCTLSIGNHTYATARGSESHEFLRDCFSPVWIEVSELIQNPVVTVDDVQYELQIVCGSDYKVRIHTIKGTSRIQNVIFLHYSFFSS